MSYRVAVVGATGAVGTVMLAKLRERKFPASEIVPFASERSAGKELDGAIIQPLNDEIGKVSVVGAGMRSHPGVAATVFRVLGQAEINIEMISTSPIKISCVVREEHVAEAVRQLHTAFELGADQVEAEHPFGPQGARV